jgi:phosphoribosylformimino-5-aminoimidazole carboxamide ribotide isomerase
MDLFPAIDLRAGEAIRLRQGDFDDEVRYGDPLALAERFAGGGARWLHVVDLDAARTGIPHERATLARIVARVGPGVRVQAGGGIRTEDDVAAVLDMGVARVVLGTAALEDPAVATRCARRWPGQVAVGVDYRGAEIATSQARAQGWKVTAPLSIPSLLEEWSGEPVGAVIATSIARDGMLEGPDVAGMAALLALTTTPVIASGGVGTLEDLRALASLSVEANGVAGLLHKLAGIIVGKALIEERFSVEEAVAACTTSA